MQAARLGALLDRFDSLTVLVAGDYFLDKYLDIDPGLSETSLETGRPAYQVVGVRRYPGAAGTVASNLRALGVKVTAVGCVGHDGEGDDLLRALAEIGVHGDGMIHADGRFTPTYLKPMLLQAGAAARELNRLDTKNHSPLPIEVETAVTKRLLDLVPSVQGVIIADQVTEPGCGVVTRRVRECVAELARAFPTVIFAADSREHIGDFRDVIVKPNGREARRATGRNDLRAAGQELRRRTGRAACITDGERGMLVFEHEDKLEKHVQGIKVTGPIDMVGAGDSAMAGLVAALCAGAPLEEAALVGNLVASITIQQLGVTGTATRAQVLERFEELNYSGRGRRDAD